MADQQQQIPNAPFPAPPPFWKHFTSENLSRLKALKESNTKAEDSPLELTYLEPPTPPSESYTIFGEEQSVRALHSTPLSSLADHILLALNGTARPLHPRNPPTLPLPPHHREPPRRLPPPHRQIPTPELRRTNYNPVHQPRPHRPETRGHQEPISECALVG